MYSLTCTIAQLENITAELQPLVEWVGPGGETITSNSNGISFENATTSGDTTTSVLDTSAKWLFEPYGAP